MTFHRSLLTLCAVAAVSSIPVAGLASKSQSLSITGAWSRETAAGQVVAGGFMTLTNRGRNEDRLISATSPIAKEVQIHTMAMDGGVMRMRQLTTGIPVPAGATVELRPGGLHIMFMGLKQQLRQGQRFPVTLQFERAGRITVQVAVQPVGSTGPKGAAHGGQ